MSILRTDPFTSRIESAPIQAMAALALQIGQALLEWVVFNLNRPHGSELEAATTELRTKIGTALAGLVTTGVVASILGGKVPKKLPRHIRNRFNARITGIVAAGYFGSQTYAPRVLDFTVNNFVAAMGRLVQDQRKQPAIR